MTILYKQIIWNAPEGKLVFGKYWIIGKRIFLKVSLLKVNPCTCFYLWFFLSFVYFLVYSFSLCSYVCLFRLILFVTAIYLSHYWPMRVFARDPRGNARFLWFQKSIAVDTRRFNVCKTSIRRRWRLIDVETTSCIYWDGRLLFIENNTFFLTLVTWNPFNTWYPIKGHTYLNKPAAFSCRFVN